MSDNRSPATFMCISHFCTHYGRVTYTVFDGILYRTVYIVLLVPTNIVVGKFGRRSIASHHIIRSRGLDTVVECGVKVDSYVAIGDIKRHSLHTVRPGTPSAFAATQLADFTADHGFLLCR